MHKTLCVLAAAMMTMALAGCNDAAPTAPPRTMDAARLAPAGEHQRWLVRFHDHVAGTDALARDFVARHGGQLRHTFRHTIRGFSATLPAAAAEALRRDPRVASVEAQFPVRMIQATQYSAPWGLDRIDQTLGLNGTYNYGNTGTSVTVYVIDTGIDVAHPEFGGRASLGFDACVGGCAAGDPHGHGTHVAGIIGAATYGVAKNVSLVSIRVTDQFGRGWPDDIVAGVDAVTGIKIAEPTRLMVANMSVSVPVSANLDLAVGRSIGRGVTYVAGAGNDNHDACNNSPGRVAEVITVAGTTSADRRMVYPDWGSNFGSCVDLFAPADNILSTWPNGGTFTLSGTSQASPHAAGWAAVYLSTYQGSQPSNIHSGIIAYSTKGVVADTMGAPNRLLYASYSSGRLPGCCR